MSRLLATLALDRRLQARNHVYVIVGIAALALALPLRTLFTPEQVHWIMPLLALSGVTLTTFFVVGVLVMLERADGTLDVALVSPLRPSEYLASKLTTLTLLAIVESLVIVFVAYGSNLSLPWLTLAVFLRAGSVAAMGVAVGARYRSLTAFLFPAIAWTVAFDVPVLWYLEIWPSPLLYLWPTFPSLLIAKSAFLPVDATHLALALGYGLLTLAASIWWALRSLDRFVVRGELPT